MVRVCSRMVLLKSASAADAASRPKMRAREIIVSKQNSDCHDRKADFPRSPAHGRLLGCLGGLVGKRLEEGTASRGFWWPLLSGATRAQRAAVLSVGSSLGQGPAGFYS